MAKKQHYMTHDERQKLEALRRAKIPVAEIARQLGFCRQTIYNELKLGSYEHEKDCFLETRYSPEKAEQLHRLRQSAKGRQLKIGHDRSYADFLERKILHDRFSPAAALAAARSAGFETRICVTTLYSYIEKGIFLDLTNKDLWVKSKRRKRAQKPQRRIVHPKLPSITERPEHINRREEYGHWEMDLIVGAAGTKPVLLTLTERLSRQEIIIKLPDRRAETISQAFDQLEKKTPNFKSKFKSLTTDNGMEFISYDRLRRSIHGGVRFEIYYCHSYAAWEKGSNENHNRMIRRWIPKGTDLTKVSKKRIAEIQNWMNDYPRGILAWLTPNEAA